MDDFSTKSRQNHTRYVIALFCGNMASFCQNFSQQYLSRQILSHQLFVDFKQIWHKISCQKRYNNRPNQF
ncbi:hypothetical protein A9308_06355 [Moraxella atlantae]|uniref:Uncharacterized protein n=1 Tax=Faucicola atlantae TaxID=34059 RepID=A0A1B8QC94_9GAMM|nr:hypothetical protein A9308_06355 [Moraxella atlantae]